MKSNNMPYSYSLYKKEFKDIGGTHYPTLYNKKKQTKMPDDSQAILKRLRTIAGK